MHDSNRHSGGDESARVVDAVVAQHVVLGDGNDGDRQARKIGAGEGREFHRVDRGARAIGFPIPRHLRSGEVVTGGELAIRSARARRVEGRIEQQLQIRLRRAVGTKPDRQRGSKVASRAVACDDIAHAVGAELSRVRSGPVPRGCDVVERRGIGMFRGAPVIDRDDDGGQAIGEHPAQAIVRIERAGDPATSMRVQQQRKRRRGLRPVDAQCDRACFAERACIADRCEHFRRAAEKPGRFLGSFSQRGHVGLCRARGRLEHRIEEMSDMRIEHRIFGNFSQI